MNAEPAICLGPPVLTPASRIATYTQSGLWGRQSLPAIFFRHCDKQDDALALADCRPGDGTGSDTPRQMTYEEADLAVRQIAARFDACGLKPGDIIALQLPPQIEAPIALLAALGLGFIVCPIPMSWRRMEIEAALSRIGARAIVAWSDGEDQSGVFEACAAAFRVASIRFVFAFGRNGVDGVTPLTIAPDEADDPLPRRRFPLSLDANALALITWDCTAPEGPRAMARSHNECIAAGMAVVLPATVAPGSTILSAYSMASLAGLASTYIPWLMTGGLLALHEPFDVARWGRQIAVYEPDFTPVPDRLALPLARVAANAGAARGPLIAALRDAGAVPARVHDEDGHSIVRFACFGEVAIIGEPPASADAPRSARIHLSAPLGASSLALANIRCTAGHPGAAAPVEISGAAVPCAILAATAQGSGFRPAGEADDFVATGYLARPAGAGEVEIAAPPRDIARTGRATVWLAELDRLFGAAPGLADAAAIAISDPVLGQRIIAVVVEDEDGTTLDELGIHLRALGAARFKFPRALVRRREIARRPDGTPDREALARAL